MRCELSPDEAKIAGEKLVLGKEDEQIHHPQTSKEEPIRSENTRM